MGHTPEPWALIKQSTEFGNNELSKIVGKAFCSKIYNMNVEEGQTNGQRIVDCVNACSGFDNPKAAIEQLTSEIDAIRLLTSARFNETTIQSVERMLNGTKSGIDRICHEFEENIDNVQKNGKK